MKKFLKTGKKALSVFMAALMVLTAWVFVAPEELKASATAGNYTYRIHVNVTDGAGTKEGTLTTTYMTLNGTSGTDTDVATIPDNFISGGGSSISEDFYYPSENGRSIAGFPISCVSDCEMTNWLNGIAFSIEIQLKKSNGTWVTISNRESDATGIGDTNVDPSVSTYGYNYPYAETITWTPTTLSNMTCPKPGNAAATQSFSVSAVDQYGVTMFDPTLTISSSQSASDSSLSVSSTEISVASGANLSGTTDTQTVTVKAKWDTPNSTGNTSKESSKSFTLTDAKVSYKFTGIKKADGTAAADVTGSIYYGRTPTAPTEIPTYTTASDDYDHVFDSWTPAVDELTAASSTFTATYTAVFHRADYAAVNTALDAADEIMNDSGYEGMYTEASRATLEAAVASARSNMNLGKSNQATVNGMANNINTAIDSLEGAKYSVVFMNSKTNSVIAIRYPYGYNANIVYPANPADFYDETNHYSFSHWSGSANEPQSELTKATKNLTILAKFSSNPHNYIETAIASTCQTSAGTKYTCDCGYERIEYTGTNGDHVLAAEYTVDYPATCLNPGQESRKCTICGEAIDIRDIEPLGHDYTGVEAVERVEAGCNNLGISTKECTRCDHVEIITTAANGHTLGAAQPHAATCITSGYTTRDCINCDYVEYSAFTQVIDHTFILQEDGHEDSTCTAMGKDVYKCSVCGTEKNEALPFADHNWKTDSETDSDGYKTVIESTCLKNGIEVRQCEVCLREETHTIPATGSHSYVTRSNTTATCVAPGLKLIECEKCGTIDTNVSTPAKGHEYGEPTSHPADCTHGAYTEQVCTREGCTEATPGHSVITVINSSQALGHDFDELNTDNVTITTNPKCDEPGSKTVKCARNGCNAEKVMVISATGHNMQPIETVAPTCLKSGYTVYTCNVCGDTYSVITDDATGHNYQLDTTDEDYKAATCEEGGTDVFVCSNGDCDARYTSNTPKTGHTYSRNTAESTTVSCTDPAINVYECSNCDSSYTEYVAAPTGHNWGQWEIINEATTQATGLQQHTCATCGTTEEGVIAKLSGDGHNYKVIIVPATCETDGYEEYTCLNHENCGYTITLTKLGHDAVIQHADASCTAAGYSKIVCRRENCSIADKVVANYEIPKLEHKMVVDSTTPAKCNADGSITYKCEYNCGTTNTVTITRNASGHNFSSVGTIENTCLTPKYEMYRCEYCVQEYYVVIDQPLGHNYEAEASIDKAPTCIEDGSQSIKCLRCGDVKPGTVETVTKLNHEGAAWETKTVATCVAPGVEKLVCPICSLAVDARAIPALDHNFVVDTAASTSATCVVPGVTVSKCSNVNDGVPCTAVKQEVTSADMPLGHDWGEWVITTPATDTTDGEKTRTCQNDDCNETETCIIPMMGHAWNLVDSKAPSCSEEGYEKYECTTCANCAAGTKTEKTVVLPKTDHEYKLTVASEPDCTTAGSQKVECKKCGAVAMEVAIPATGHDYVRNDAETYPATCMTPGKVTYTCSRNCGSSLTETIDMLPHVYDMGEGKGTYDVVPTCNEGGKIRYTCSTYGCTASTVLDVPKNGHSYVTETPVAATCEAIGYTRHYCTACSDGTEGHAYVTDVTVPTGHNYQLDTTDADYKAATCTEDGVDVYVCSRCGDSYTVETSKTGHKYDSGVKVQDASCTEPEETTYTCTNGCDNDTPGRQYTVITATANGHDWSDWEIIDPTNDTDGSVSRHCNVASCTAVETITLPKGNHSFDEGEATREASCTQTGEIKYSCITEGHTDSFTVETSMLAHVIKVEQSTDPTCTENGEIRTYCENCDLEITTEIPALGHKFDYTDLSAATVTEPATCEATGKGTLTCLNCSETTEVTLPKLGHNMQVAGTVAATCTTDSYIIYECANSCGLRYIVGPSVSDKTGHHYAELDASEDIRVKDPTCEEDGMKILKCPGCNDVIEKVLPKTGHDYSTVVTAATCHSHGYTTYTCRNNCGSVVYNDYVAPTGNHNIVKDEANSVDATCESKGYYKEICSNEGCDYSNGYIIDATGHDFDEVVTDPTCTESGYTTHTCSKCNKEYIDTIVSPKGHTYNNGVVIREATALEKGVVEYTCSACTDKYYDEYVDDASAHIWSINVVEPTCTSTGLNIYTCTRENCEACKKANVEHLSFQKVIPAKSHNYVEDESVYIAPDCENDGTRTLKCSNCSDVKVETVPATGHNFRTEVFAATCTEAGYTQYTCNVAGCGYVKRDNFTLPEGHDEAIQVVNPTCIKSGYTIVTCNRPNCSYKSIPEDLINTALGHDYAVKTYNPAGCTTEGSVTYECSRCHDDSYDETIPATGHSMVPGATQTASCTQAGYVQMNCENCPYSYMEYTGGPTNHDFGEWIREIEPTNDEDGKDVRTCSVCHLSEHRTVSKFGHIWSTEGEYFTESDKPTCTTEGVLTFKCVNEDCETCLANGTVATYTQSVLPLGHNVVPETKNATCYETGYIKYNCSRCPYQAFDEVTIPKIAHTWGEPYFDEGDEPTCTSAGIRKYKCTVSECTSGFKSETVSMLPHDFETQTTPATCITNSYTTYCCKSCHLLYTIADPDTVLGHEFEEKERQEATCEANGYVIYKCKRCEETKTDVINKLGHSWSPWETKVEATCSDAGIQIRTCLNNADHKQECAIEPTGIHEWKTTVWEPTCTEMGFVVYACKGCGIIKRGDWTVATGHNYNSGVYEEATCTREGGTVYTCTNPGCTHTYKIVDTPALGHSMSKYEMIVYPGDPNAFAKQRKCLRDGCTYTERESGAEGPSIVNKYYKVEYHNAYATKEYEYPDKTAYFEGTPLAKSYKDEIVDTIYVLKGTEAVYTAATPVREKDRDVGAYKFTGWDLGSNETSLTNVTKNIKAYAKFEGLEIYYAVRFYNKNALPLSQELRILHGHQVSYNWSTPTLPSETYLDYTFTGWDRNLDHIYSSGSINALYEEHYKKFVLVYRDWNGTKLGSEEIEYFAPARNVPQAPTRTADSTYIYEFSGKWLLENGQEINLESVNPGAVTETVNVYAKYYQRFKQYDIKIEVYDADGIYVPGAAVQVLNSVGQLAYTGYTNADGEIIFKVVYDTVYTAQITDTEGNSVQKSFTLPHETPIKLQFEDNRNYEESKCKCICHSFLGGLWISMLNVLYKLFRIKHVCCYDMYATHGDKLVYAQ